MDDKPTIYGIEHSSRKREDFWTKNTFNSTFPIGLANYMRDKGIKANYITVTRDLDTIVKELDIGEMYNAHGIPNSELNFQFESRFEPYQKYSYTQIPGIDSVIKDTHGNYLRPLEVKLTVIPDKVTTNGDESTWGSELVFRPPTAIYCALGMMDRCPDVMPQVREIFEDTCHDIGNWDSNFEVNSKMPGLCDVLDNFERKFCNRQQPLVMQPIWKTKGQSPVLCDDAFDIFVWSDYAFSRLFLDRSRKDEKMTRPKRSTARMARCIYEISKSGKVDLDSIYGKMTFDLQSDKEFSAPGNITNGYMTCPRLKKPAIGKNELYNIILNGGEQYLMPERRFDQTLYFTMVNQNR